jgi:hypothetical protein
VMTVISSVMPILHELLRGRSWDAVVELGISCRNPGPVELLWLPPRLTGAAPGLFLDS